MPAAAPQKAWLLPTVVGLSLLIFLKDIRTPLGVADFILYFVPIALTALSQNPLMPIGMALFVSILSVGGYFMSPPGVDTWIAILNRVLGTLVTIFVAELVRRLIRSRNIGIRHTWLQAGLTGLVYKLRGDKSIDDVSADGLEFLAGYIGAQVGALYVASEDGNSLQRTAGYGLDEPEPLAPSTLSPRYGLFHLAITAGRPLLLDDLPAGYLKVGSALGSTATPRMLVVPLVSDERLRGVLEFGFLEPPVEGFEQLMESIAEPFAIGIRSAQTRARLSELLSESRRQSEKLQTQQEELHVVNEELEEQSRALQASHVRLQNQQAELEQSNQQLEEQAQILEHQKNDLIGAREEIARRAVELERASRYKSEFLANMSHELRTPLNSSLILARLLADNREGNLTEEQVKYAETILKSGNDLLTLINDILDLSKVEAGKLEIAPEPVSVRSIVEGLETVFRPIAAQKNLRLEIEVAPETPSLLTTDPRRLEQILKNFLSNAIKFTERGQVKLRVFPKFGGSSDPSATPSGVSFAVSDTGIGIAADQQEVIFEAFRQADGSTNRKFGGTGLGLSISRQLAHLLGGSIRVASELGHGSTFTLDLPLEAPSESRQSPAALATAPLSPPSLPASRTGPLPSTESQKADDRDVTTPRARKLVIIEDDTSFARILYDLAHEMHFDALIGATADEGLRLVREHQPQAVLLDLCLPDHGGLAVLDLLKSDPKTRHIPVHVLSAEDFSRTALEMGAVGCALKPRSRDQLLETFGAIDRKINRQIRRVLVVEDDKTQRESVLKLLAGPDTEIIPATTGQAALDSLAAHELDCIVMDLALPDIPGDELLDRMAEQAGDRPLPPVIVYTGRDLSRDEEEKLRKRSGSIIIKGARSPERLLSEVTLFLHRVESRLPTDHQKMLRELRNRNRTLEGKDILIVDDDVRNIFALTSVLEPQGAKLHVARNGREALEQLAAKRYMKLVLMDIMMPEMDGYEAMRRIRAQKDFEELPIIAITAKAMRDDQERCIAAGANDYISKPLDVDKLLSLARVWVTARETS